MKKKLLLVLLMLVLTCGVLTSVAGVASAETTAPQMSIAYCNLSFRDSVCIKYAVKSNVSGVKILLWTSPRAEYTVGTQDSELTKYYTENIGGVPHMVFDYTDLSAKQMADVVYARAYVRMNGTDYYSDVNKYSILQYAYNKLGKTATASSDAELKEMLSNMLAYGASAQKYFDYKEDRLATADWYQVELADGVLEDGCTFGLYLPGDTVTLTAAETNENGESFSYWADQNGNQVATTATCQLTDGTENAVYTPVYGGAYAAVDVGAIRFDSEQALTDEQKAQARENIGAAAADYVPTVAPRAQIRQIKPYVEEVGKLVTFEDVYAFVDANQKAPTNQCTVIYALEAHSQNSTTQRVFKSYDGEKWSVLATLTVDTANGKWFTDLFVDGANAYHATAKETLYLMKTNDGFTQKQNQFFTFIWNGKSWYQSGMLELGVKRWLGNNNSIDVCTSADWSKRTIIFGEYATTTDGSTYKLWRSQNNGSTWETVLELGGDTGGVTGNGEIRHWHAVQVDPYTKHWWAAAGDAGKQCRIYRSTDDGTTWDLMFSGTQKERTCGFVFEEDCIYYAMDATSAKDMDYVKIFKIDRSKLETDTANAREEVAVVDSAFAVYGLTRTACPDGFIVWAQQEPGASATPGRYILQFYDYATKKLYPIAYFDTSDIDNSKYIGFYAGARTQHSVSGAIIAKPTRALQHERYSNTGISTHVKIDLIM